MILIKVSHTVFNNGHKDLSTKDFLKHDLVHFAVDKVLGIYDPNDPMKHTPEIEQVAGIMHAVYDETISNARILEGAENMFSAQGRILPSYMTNTFIDEVRKEACGLLKRYQFLKTGESLELQ